jgi:hypothetical protein
LESEWNSLSIEASASQGATTVYVAVVGVCKILVVANVKMYFHVVFLLDRVICNFM